MGNGKCTRVLLAKAFLPFVLVHPLMDLHCPSIYKYGANKMQMLKEHLIFDSIRSVQRPFKYYLNGTYRLPPPFACLFATNRNTHTHTSFSNINYAEELGKSCGMWYVGDIALQTYVTRKGSLDCIWIDHICYVDIRQITVHHLHSLVLFKYPCESNYVCWC